MQILNILPQQIYKFECRKNFIRKNFKHFKKRTI